MHHPRGTDIPGQGGGVAVTAREQPVCISPVVLISPVRVVVLLSLSKETDRMHHPRGTDIPGQGGGVAVTVSRYSPYASSPWY